ncbi:cell shape-determining protein [Clostridium botulinum]|nr:cell shape-determining protein [Clostridium botulinum]NFI89946.1 cell shape-determining protein [Clostridium botulinum]
MDNKKSFSFLKLLLGAYVCVGIVLLLTNNLIFDLSLNSVLITGIFVLCSVVYGVLHKNKKNVMAGGTVAVIYIILAVVCSPIISYNSHRNLIGNIHEVDFSSEIQYIDLNQLPTIDKELAEKLADKKLGEIASLGSQVYVGTLELQNINGELYYVAPLEHSSLFKWFTNRKGTAGYIKVSATNQNDVQLVTQLDGKDLAIKYLDSSYLFSNLRRAAFFRDMKAGHTDYTFELDDNGKPYWVVTRYDNAVGIAETKAVGALIMDAQSGESQVYNIDNLPSWVDRIQPSTYIKRYIDKWGELVHGIFNFSDKDKLKTTSGMNVIYNNDTCYYYTGITSVGSDESLVGFTLTNTRSGETKLYKTAGATESASMKSAEGKVQQYAMVNVKNYNTVGVGDTLQSTLNKYLEGLTNTNISLEGGSKEETVLGEVERIGVIVKEGTSIYDVKLKGTDNIFSISTEMSREVALTSVGDSVSVKYINVGNSKYVITNYFENVSLSSTEANKEVEKTQE